MRTDEVKRLMKKRDLLMDEVEGISGQLTSVGIDYEEFFTKYRSNKKFKLYKLPSIERFKAYIEFCGEKDSYGKDNSHHPLDYQSRYHVANRTSYSYFNPEELAVLIRMIYEYQTGKECGIMTIGNMVEVPGFCNVYPRLHYVVGEKKKLEEYEEYNGKFYEELDKFKFDQPQEGLIAVPHTASERTFNGNPLFSGSSYGKTMDYYEYKTVGEMATGYFNNQENIFRRWLKKYLDEINSHRDLFTFKIADDDDFISTILYSIMMYKWQNNIVTLSDSDYDKIIATLYNKETTLVSQQVMRDIPKQLVYVQNDEVRERFKDSRWKQ